jgi:hypothetical protein
VLHIPSTDSPNVKEGRVVIPGLATHEWISEMRDAYGDGSTFFTARIRGDFPTTADGQLISLALVEEAQRRWHEQIAHFETAGPLILGVDVARFGDDESVIFVRRGNVVLKPEIFRGVDTVDLACHALRLARDRRHEHERPLIRVDVIGIGAGVVDHLKRHDDVDVEEINVGAASRFEQYARLRDETWFRLRDWLKDGGCLPPDDKLAGELIAPVYQFTPGQKMQVESKDDLRKKLKRSPDRADALALAVLDGPPRFGTASVYDSPLVLRELDEAGASFASYIEDRHGGLVGRDIH